MGMAVAAIASNLLVTRLLPWRLHVPAGLAAAGVVSLLATRAGAGLRDQGLDYRLMPQGLLYGLAGALPAAAVAAGGATHSRSAELYAVQSITQASPRRALYEVLLRIPFGTALSEELIFRGALQGVLCRRHGPAQALVVSSLLFGLWHLPPAFRQSGASGLVMSSSRLRMAHATVSVAATAIAGVVLGYLRQRSKSVAAPWLTHAAANGAGFAAGWLVTREMAKPSKTGHVALR
jgi:membrane protease YdiL (CAAX protease family)